METPRAIRPQDVEYQSLLNTAKKLKQERQQWLPWRGTAYAVPQYRGSTRIIFFAPSDEKTVIG